MTLDPNELAKVCDRFSSPNEVERASAAKLADSVVKEAGLSWQQIINNNEAEVQGHPNGIAIWKHKIAKFCKTGGVIFLGAIAFITFCAAWVTGIATIWNLLTNNWPGFANQGVSFVASSAASIVTYFITLWLNELRNDNTLH